MTYLNACFWLLGHIWKWSKVMSGSILRNYSQTYSWDHVGCHAEAVLSTVLSLWLQVMFVLSLFLFIFPHLAVHRVYSWLCTPGLSLTGSRELYKCQRSNPGQRCARQASCCCNISSDPGKRFSTICLLRNSMLLKT